MKYTSDINCAHGKVDECTKLPAQCRIKAETTQAAVVRQDFSDRIMHLVNHFGLFQLLIAHKITFVDFS